MKGNILILDDNKSVLTALEMLFQEEFGNVFTLKNPNTLHILAQNGHWFLLIPDSGS